MQIPPPPRLLPEHLMFLWEIGVRLLLRLAPTTATEQLNPTIMRSSSTGATKVCIFMCLARFDFHMAKRKLTQRLLQYCH